MNINAKDNITIVNSEREVIAIVSEKEIVVKEGYEVLVDVGEEDKLLK